MTRARRRWRTLCKRCSDYSEVWDGKTDRGEAYRDTLQDRPWRDCRCELCRTLGIQITVFRGTERNKRRGFHNLYVFRQRLRTQLGEDQRDPGTRPHRQGPDGNKRYVFQRWRSAKARTGASTPSPSTASTSATSPLSLASAAMTKPACTATSARKVSRTSPRSAATSTPTPVRCCPTLSSSPSTAASASKQTRTPAKGPRSSGPAH